MYRVAHQPLVMAFNHLATNNMVCILHTVPVVSQGEPGYDSPICWVACAAMVLSHYQNRSIGIDYLIGASPHNSSIAAQSSSVEGDRSYQRLESWGFHTESPRHLSEGYIMETLVNHGPFILSHYCQNFPYGLGIGNNFTAQDAHAVVITGISGNTLYFNNPWGNENVPAGVSRVIPTVEKYAATTYRYIAYMP